MFNGRRLRALAGCLSLAMGTGAGLALPLRAQTPIPTTLPEAMTRAAQAQQKGDLPEMRRMLRSALTFAPDAGQLLFFLAREEARAGNSSEAFDLLDRLATQGSLREIEADTGFAPLKAEATRARFAAIAGRIKAMASPLVRSDTMYVLRDADFIPEGMADDPVGGVFYVGSLHRKSVVRIDRSGAESVFLESGRDGLGQVLGLRVDGPRRRLWLATLAVDSAAPRHANGGGGWAFLYEYELPSGRFVARYAAPDSTRPHLLNDLVVTQGGAVYVTDTEAHAVYALARGAKRLEQVHGGRDTFRYPNGIALDSAERRLYVAHGEGISIAAIDASRPAAAAVLTLLPRPDGVSTGGIDGLYACRGRLVAVQALFGFQQVTAFQLAPDGNAITSASALERRHPIYDWATTGALVGGDFFYLPNAQLRRLSNVGVLSPPTIPGRSVVLRLRGVCKGA